MQEFPTSCPFIIKKNKMASINLTTKEKRYIGSEGLETYRLILNKKCDMLVTELIDKIRREKNHIPLNVDIKEGDIVTHHNQK